MLGFVMREREWGRAEVEAEGLGWYKLQNKHIIIYYSVYTPLPVLIHHSGVAEDSLSKECRRLHLTLEWF